MVPALDPPVGIPRALLVYDFAPLLIGFLNALNVKVILSSKTTKEIMEQAVELSYTDSCFPLKLVHGHTANLKNVDYILYPVRYSARHQGRRRKPEVLVSLGSGITVYSPRGAWPR